MSVQDAVRTVPGTRTVTIPRQAGPVDPETAAPAAGQAAARRDNRMTAEERAFAVGLVWLFVFLSVVVAGGLVLAVDVWS